MGKLKVEELEQICFEALGFAHMYRETARVLESPANKLRGRVPDLTLLQYRTFNPSSRSRPLEPAMYEKTLRRLQDIGSEIAPSIALQEIHNLREARNLYWQARTGWRKVEGREGPWGDAILEFTGKKIP